MLTTFVRVTNEAAGLPDAVVTGLAAMLGAGILVGIAPAASASGAWLLAGLALAALVAVACGLSTSESTGVVQRTVTVLGRAAGASAIGGAFGRYLVPENPRAAAVALLAVTTVLVALGVRLPRTLLRAGVVVVLAVLAVFVAACFAIEPPPNAPGGNDPSGLPAATAILVFGFLGTDRKLGTRRHRMIAIGVALVIYLAVAGAALYQLGGARLGLSPVPLRDALAAADASGIDAVVTVGAVLATVLALFGVLADLWADDEPRDVAVAGFAMALGTMLLTVPALMVVAVALMVGDRLLGLATSRRGSGSGLPRSGRS
jgi:APA family basic amino acid/polyamine antiporter